MNNANTRPAYMRCVGIRARRSPVHTGNYVPVVSIDGKSPNRHAVIMDCWGGARSVREREDGRWQLTVEDGDTVAEFVTT
jgi:hypothetical protein